MNWDALGALSELVGAIGVVVTLAYLAIQIRLNSEAVKAGAAQTVMQSMSEYFRAPSESPQLAGLLTSAFANFDELEEAEITQMFYFVFSWFRLVELAHHHYRLGNIPDSFWDGQITLMSSLMRTPAIFRFWDVRKNVFSGEFRNFIDGLDLTSDIPGSMEVIATYRKGNAA